LRIEKEETQCNYDSLAFTPIVPTDATDRQVKAAIGCLQEIVDLASSQTSTIAMLALFLHRQAGVAPVLRLFLRLSGFGFVNATRRRGACKC
jgi:hypothetical protein